jgi:hypothetical protein
MFSERQYTVADSAYENNDHMVSAYCRYRGNNALMNRQTRFNVVLSTLRIISEHTIGMLKGQFPWLKSIPAKMSEDEESMQSIIKYMKCCMILHNFLSASNDDFPNEWLVAGRDNPDDIGEDQPDLEEQENAAPRDRLRTLLTNYVELRNL